MINKAKEIYNLEKFIFHVWAKTIQRDPKKYTSVVVKSYLMWLLQPKNITIQVPLTQKQIQMNLLLPRVSQWIRLSYFFGRYIDDIVDGDELPPAQYKNNIKKYIKNIKTWKENTEIISKVMNKIIQTYQTFSPDIKNYLHDFLDAMVDEHDRRLNKAAMSKKELIKLHDKSFRWAHEIYLCALWSQQRAKNIAELPQILWRIYAIKDLKDDIKNGIYNIPSEYIKQETYQKKNTKEIIGSSEVKKRIEDTLQEQSINIQQLRNKKLDNGAKRICEWLLPEIEKFIKEYEYKSYIKQQTNDMENK